MKRSQTAPLKFDFASNTGKTQTPTPEIRLEGGLMSDNAQHGQKGLLLNVDIPTTQLERYSVMFGSVLQKPPNTVTSSSLLARRQATLDRLKTVNEALALKVSLEAYFEMPEMVLTFSRRSKNWTRGQNC